MDEYLESLVRKGESTPEEVAEVEEEVVEAAEEVVSVEAGTEALTEEEIEAPEEVDVPAEPEEVVEVEEQPEESKVIAAEEPILGAAPIPDCKEGDLLSVDKIRIYNTPNIKTVSRIYSGNVIYLGKICDFSIIEYMKHGFGMVKGYTPDLFNN